MRPLQISKLLYLGNKHKTTINVERQNLETETIETTEALNMQFGVWGIGDSDPICVCAA